MDSRGRIIPLRRGRRPISSRSEAQPPVMTQGLELSNPFNASPSVESLDIPSTPTSRHRAVQQNEFLRLLQESSPQVDDVSSHHGESNLLRNAIRSGRERTLASGVNQGPTRSSSSSNSTLYPTSQLLSSQRDIVGNLDEQDITETPDFAQRGTLVYSRPSTPMKRRQNIAFEHDQDQPRNYDNNEEDDNNGDHDHAGISVIETPQQPGGSSNSNNNNNQLFRRRRQQHQQRRQGQEVDAGISSISSPHPNVFLSTPSSSSTMIPGEFFLQPPHTPAPSQFEFRKEFPTTPVGRRLGGGQPNDLGTLWSGAGRRAVMQLKYGISGDDESDDEERLDEKNTGKATARSQVLPTLGDERSGSSLFLPFDVLTGSSADHEETVAAEAEAEDESVGTPFIASKSRKRAGKIARQRLPTLIRQGSSSRSDDLHAYQEGDLGDSLSGIPNPFLKVNTPKSLDGNIDYSSEGITRDDSGYNVSGNSIDHNHIANQSMESEGTSGTDDVTKLFERRVQERVEQMMAASGKSGSSWSSSTGGGRVIRDGRGESSTGLPNRRESSRARKKQQQQELRQRVQQISKRVEEKAEENIVVEEPVVVEEHMESDAESQIEPIDNYVGRQLEYEMYIELESYEDDALRIDGSPELDARIRSQLEKDMDLELEDYQESSFDGLNDLTMGLFTTESLLDDLDKDYSPHLTTPEELENLTWMYEEARISKSERIFSKR
ncbi:hypothetical protein BGZ76_006486 [Entomortierella beljakovae]|nr:hypothetical protein BGZ76_006486 [Entomortierella beljakovae]